MDLRTPLFTEKLCPSICTHHAWWIHRCTSVQQDLSNVQKSSLGSKEQCRGTCLNTTMKKLNDFETLDIQRSSRQITWIYSDLTNFKAQGHGWPVDGYPRSPSLCSVHKNANHSTWASSHLHNIFPRYSAVLYFYLCLGLQSDLFTWGFPTKIS
jgi:hypothetical protein